MVGMWIRTMEKVLGVVAQILGSESASTPHEVGKGWKNWRFRFLRTKVVLMPGMEEVGISLNLPSFSFFFLLLYLWC